MPFPSRSAFRAGYWLLVPKSQKSSVPVALLSSPSALSQVGVPGAVDAGVSNWGLQLRGGPALDPRGVSMPNSGLSDQWLGCPSSSR